MTKKNVQIPAPDAPPDLSPRQVAQAIGVSESSLKRWCDRGELEVTKTAGGHRRIPREAVVRFLREQGLDAKRPDLLGLPAGARLAARQSTEVLPRLVAALETGDEGGLTALVTGLYLAKVDLAAIADDYFRRAFEIIGEKWSHGELEIYQEHRAVVIALNVLGKLGAFLPVPNPAAPTAVIATLAGDFYTLSITLIELALRERGWNTAPLGPNHPIDTLCAAVADLSPRLICVNVSHISNEAELLAATARLYEAATARGSAVAIGGGALTEELRRQIPCTAHCRTIAELVSLARGLEPRIPPAS